MPLSYNLTVVCSSSSIISLLAHTPLHPYLPPPSLHLRYYWTMVGDPRGDLVEAAVQLLCLVLDYYPHSQVNRLQAASQAQQAQPEPGAGNLFCGYVSRLHQNEVIPSFPPSFPRLSSPPPSLPPPHTHPILLPVHVCTCTSPHISLSIVLSNPNSC